jgi:molybdate transport system regulatory protein
MKANEKVGAKIQIVVEPGVRIGPGKADVLQGIKDTGSISAAGRRIGMSYKRAWYLVEAMNAHFGRPLVEASKGGKSGGGAKLTSLGEEVLSAFREMEAATDKAIAPILRRLRRQTASSSPD